MNRRAKIFHYLIYTILCTGLLLPFLSTRDVAAAKAADARIHFINLDANNDAILLECNGAFGMVDSGEDNSYPDGSDKRYPWRAGIVKNGGQGQNVIQYLRSVGVKRLEFYIGTHPHSDHIGNAHQIIRTFRPKRVYLRPYKDSYITNKTRLWDNLFVYDNALNAIKEVNSQAASAEDGITLIQYLKPGAAYIDPLRKIRDSSNKNSAKSNSGQNSPAQTYQTAPEGQASADASPNEELPVNEEIAAVPEESAIEENATATGLTPSDDIPTQTGFSQDEAVVDYTPMVPNDTYDAAPLSLTGNSKPQTARPTFTLGDGMTIQIMNYNAKLSAPDANYFCLGVKVTANGSTAFLAGDINNYRGTEDCLAKQLGHVDVLKLGHHGYYGSNTTHYLRRLSPDIAVLTGRTGQTRQQMWDALASTKTRTYITTLYASSVGATVVNMDSRVSTNIAKNESLSEKIVSGYSASMQRYIYLKNGKKVVGGGFQRSGRTGYYFPTGSTRPLTDRWLKYRGKWYYFGEDGKMMTSWFKLDSHWYYCDEKGIMQTGWLKHKGKNYYLTSKGHMVTGDKKIGRYWYHFRSNGSMYTGWLHDRYYYDEQGRWIPGRSRSGWQKYNAGYKWRYKNGTYAKDTWKTIKGSRYYFGHNGYRATGITAIAGKKYYFSSNGKLTTGWQTVDGKRYYFTAKGMYTGFQKVNGKRYYFNTDGTLHQGQGPKTIQEKTYFFNSDHSIATGWKTIGDRRHYFTASGVMALGWQTIGQAEYYFDSSGAALTGLQTLKGCSYLFDGSGVLQKAPAPGWHSFNGTDHYYFQTERTLHTGWLALQVPDGEGTLQTHYHYLDPATGIMATGLVQLPDRDDPAGNASCYYYFQPPQEPLLENAMDWGMMVTGTTVTVEEDGRILTYIFDENGKGSLLPEEALDVTSEMPPGSDDISDNSLDAGTVISEDRTLTVEMIEDH